VIGQLPKRLLTLAAFFLKVELFSTLCMAEKTLGEAFKKTAVTFSRNALLHRNRM
jgi:hypothetical protein